jgi:hypothetical protein
MADLCAMRDTIFARSIGKAILCWNFSTAAKTVTPMVWFLGHRLGWTGRNITKGLFVLPLISGIMTFTCSRRRYIRVNPVSKGN